MSISIWLPALAGAGLVLYLLSQRVPSTESDSATRHAALVGVRRALGESDKSLQRRATARSRWPYATVAPDVAWWAQLLNKIGIQRQ